VVDALRRIHRSLVPGGALLDMQPALADPSVLGADGVLGRMDGRALQAMARATDTGLAGAVGAGLFRFETEVFLDLVHRFDTAAELVGEVDGWRWQKLTPEARQALARSSPPFEVHERCLLRRLRASEPHPISRAERRD